MSTDSAWDTFTGWYATIADLDGIGALLGWDRETAMPPGGSESRASQLGTLAALRHRELTRPDVADAVAELAEADLPAARAAAVRRGARARNRALLVPEDLVRASSEAGSRCVSAWVQARPAGDFAAVAPLLETVVALRRQEAEALLAAGGDEPYDALLEEFEPGARAAGLEPLFARLAEGLAPMAAAARRDADLPDRTWPREAQVALARHLAEVTGFDLRRGALAESAHPFTSSPGVGDVRWTTRVDESSPLPSALAAMHELGHALYEQGLPAEYARTPVAEAPSLGAHESQSRFWENHVGRTDAFWELLAPTMRGLFPEAMQGVSAADIGAASRTVRPSLIRVEADEVTYNLHIVLRFQLELALVRGDLAVADLPGAWDDGMERLLGIRPDSPANGAMQDIHWHDGLIGYFPTYTLGNLYAAQLADAMEPEIGPLEEIIAGGRLDEPLAWLRENVHRHGSLMPAGELMQAATGRPLEEGSLLAYLERVYLS